MHLTTLDSLCQAGYITLPKVCGVTSRSKPTIWRWCKQGLFPAPVKIGPNSTAWRIEDVREWVADPQAWQLRARQRQVDGGRNE
ncbi:AlpA family phage regulatory protein [Comamonas aquatica]|uniref:AlpA family phage regulatory protein n=2 Tax=Comamonadaceae TaxID=80864 RepID=A0AA42W2H5_9BURK|nr:AlpA family phage regulatory protein [Comamonas aquatica]MDE1557030.1 AlpA family phage regulatory protein [Comamonas aquatica]MDH1428029.1 AlpA family phage regulatory protein [Comamonas aquatica]MDH1606167.1 AlpA family phage regulatory protein [Comamonas aquatica]MDH1617948.1 AlpA family phage regulatory protein [Comamonas aquatica]MDH2006080.1 AlpA family phage regulatory protein [Comamonas aquatica]